MSGLCVRAAVDRAINESVGSYRSAGLISALAVGTRHRLGDHAWQVLAATGLSHLVAISGLHIGLVGGFGFLAVKKLLRHIVIPGPLQPVDIAAATALVLAAVYAALAGFSLPTSRALVMMAVVAVSVFLRREPAPDRILAAALIGALLVDPMAPLSAGFWLSFAAVGIIFFGTRLRSQRLSTIASLYRLQTRLFLMMAPLVLLLFDQVSLVGPFVNMIAIPLFSLVLIPLVLVATLLSGIVPGLSRLIWQICAATIDKIWPGLEWVAQTPVAQWQPADRPLALLALLMIGVVVLALPRGIPGRWLGILLCLPALQWQPVLPEPGAFRFTLLDVGQGLAAVVQTENHTLVYDTGPSYRDSHTARHTVLPYLESRGISRIDILMVSHLDKDHAGGMNYIRAAVPVTQLLVGLDAAASRSGTRCMAGMNWRWDEVAFTVLHPSTGTGWNRNNGSCVLRVAGRGGALLLTGDIEYKAESNLIKSALPLSADIIVVPHHGSRTSSTVGLINSVNARYALFSSGYRNRWGLPAGEIVRRWEDAGATTLVTWSSGAVEFLVDPDTGVGRPVEYRKINRRYWTAD